MIKRILKILSLVVSGIVFLLVLLLFLIHTGSLNTFISKTLSRQVSNRMQGEVRIQSMSGSIFNNFTVHNVRMMLNDSTLVNLKSARVNYSIEQLLNKRLVINKLELNAIDIHARQEKDSTWNITRIFEPVEQRVKAKSDTGDSGFIREIQVSEFKTGPLKANLQSQYDQETIPKRIELLIELKFHLTQGRISSTINHFEFASISPDITVQDLTGAFEKVGNIISWSNLNLSLSETQLASSGALPIPQPLNASATLHFKPLAFDDFHSFIKDTELYGRPEVQLNYEGNRKKKQVDARIQRNEQIVRIDGWFEGLKDADSLNLNVVMDSLDAESWTGNSRLNTLVSGKVHISGRGTDIKTNALHLKGQYKNIHFAEYFADSIDFDLSKQKTNLNGDFYITSPAGKIRSTIKLSEIFGKMGYNVKSSLHNVNLAVFLDTSSLTSDLNFDISAKGKGIDLKTMQARLSVRSENSIFQNRPIENFTTELEVDKQNYKFSGLRMKTPYFLFGGSGSGDIKNQNDITFYFEPYDLTPLLSAFGLPDMKMRGSIEGKASGVPDSIEFNADLSFGEALYDSIQVNDLSSNVRFTYADSIQSGSVELRTGSVLFEKFRSDSLYLVSDYVSNQLRNKIYLVLNDSVRTAIDTDIKLGQVPVLTLPSIQFWVNDNTWEGGSDSTWIALGKDTIRINYFNLKSGEQEILANGRFAFEGTEKFNLNVKNLNLSKIPPDLLSGLKPGGILNANLHLDGPAEEPLLKGNLDVNRPVYENVSMSHINVDFQYDKNLFKFKGTLVDTLKHKIHTDLQIPFHFSLSDSIFILRNSRDFIANLSIDSIHTELIAPILQKEGMKIGGVISSRVKISNTIQNPLFNGDIDWREGSFSYAKQGIRYKDITMNGTFNNEKISVDRFSVRSGEGTLSASGFAGISPFSEEKIRNVDLKVNASNFRALDNRKIQATINSLLTIKGPYSNALMDGRLTVTQSTLNADAFQAEFARQSKNPNPPLLVEALEDSVIRGEIKSKAAFDTTKVKEKSFYDNLHGTFTVKVPGNTWVRGKDMNFELKGELRAVKEGPQIDLFGDLNVNRGFYKFYGKRFGFEKGNISFTGGREINPVVDFVVTYNFRDEERELRTLRLYLSGRAMNPDIRFTLDNRQLEEKDAIAYILFGRRLENLSGQQATTVEQSALSMTKNIALGQISNMLKDALQSSLNLDVVEIRGQDSWRSGKVTIGKYITDDLYLRYERTFAFDKKNKIVDPEEISLEYQILRSLFIQATNQRNNSGFDLIYKKSWK